MRTMWSPGYEGELFQEQPSLDTHMDATPKRIESSSSKFSSKGSESTATGLSVSRTLSMAAGAGGGVSYDVLTRDSGSLTYAMMRMIPEETDCPRLFKYRLRVFKFLVWYPFDYFIGVVILINAATVGIEQTLRYENKDTTIIDFLEKCFLLIYLIELGMRFFASGTRCFKDTCVLFDIVLVMFGLMSLVADMLLFKVDELNAMTFLRIGRLVRLARTARLLIKFRELWIMVRGLITSLGTIIYTMLLLLIILYTFSCLSMELVTPLRDSDNLIVKEIVSAYFSTLPQTMLTLLQFVCLDSIGAIYKPIIEHEPSLVLFFVTVILVVSIVLMNLVTAVIVNGAFENAQQDRHAIAVHEQQQKRRMLQELRAIFQHIDEVSSGKLSSGEIMGMPAQDLEILKQLTSMDEPMDIFHILDVDGDGQIGIDEFLNGLWQQAVSKVPSEMRLELKRMQKYASQQTRELREGISELHSQIRRLLSYPKVAAECDAFSVGNSSSTNWSSAATPVDEIKAFRNECTSDFFERKYAAGYNESLDSIAEADDQLSNISKSISLHTPGWSLSNQAMCNQLMTASESLMHRLPFQHDMSTGEHDDSNLEQKPAYAPELVVSMGPIEESNGIEDPMFADLATEDKVQVYPTLLQVRRTSPTPPCFWPGRAIGHASRPQASL